MAAASGPVDTSSGKTEETDVLKPPEPPRSRELRDNNDADNKPNDFKVPGINIPKSTVRDPNNTNADTHVSSSQMQSRKTPVLSPAEQLEQTQVSIPYKEPIWGGIPPESEKYSFDVLKNGTVIENVELGQKPWIVFGRLPSCDVYTEHPSLSRHHAVVQYRETREDGFECGWYLYDLDSTHGSWVNKVKVKPNVYHRLRVGHVIKFGGSSRLYILQGPKEDQEPESELSITELKQQTAKLKRETEVLKHAELEEEEERERQRQKILELRGCSWGMGEDAAEESEENPFSSLVPEHEHLYVDDPKKALKGFYEREGCDLPEYQFTEVGFGKHKCVVDLPVDGPNGEVLIAEATVSGKKKDAVVACALEACRLLDVHGMLHASKHASKKRKARNWEDDDFYDSDEDIFLDRTGTIEKKRLFRMKKSGKEVQAETYESLLPKHEQVQKRITEIETKLEQAKAQAEAAANEEEDALEAYMSAIRAGVMDTKTRLSLKRELLTLRTEEQRLRKLVNLAKPADMPELKKLEGGMKKHSVNPGVTPGVRKIAIAKGPKKPLPLPVAAPVPLHDSGTQEEEEDDDEDENDAENTSKEVAKSRPTTSNIQKAESTASDVSSKQKPTHITPSVKTVTQTDNKASAGREDIQKSSTAMAPPSVKAPKSVKKEKQEAVKVSQVKGPVMPCDVEMPQASVSAESHSSVKAAPSDQQFEKASPPVAKKKRKNTAPKKVDYDASDPLYDMWLPPENQSGDGRTSLNDKLGY